MENIVFHPTITEDTTQEGIDFRESVSLDMDNWVKQNPSITEKESVLSGLKMDNIFGREIRHNEIDFIMIAYTQDGKLFYGLNQQIDIGMVMPFTYLLHNYPVWALSYLT